MRTDSYNCKCSARLPRANESEHRPWASHHTKRCAINRTGARAARLLHRGQAAVEAHLLIEGVQLVLAVGVLVVGGDAVRGVVPELRTSPTQDTQSYATHALYTRTDPHTGAAAKRNSQLGRRTALDATAQKC